MNTLYHVLWLIYDNLSTAKMLFYKNYFEIATKRNEPDLFMEQISISSWSLTPIGRKAIRFYDYILWDCGRTHLLHIFSGVNIRRMACLFVRSFLCFLATWVNNRRKKTTCHHFQGNSIICRRNSIEGARRLVPVWLLARARSSAWMRAESSIQMKPGIGAVMNAL